MGQHAKLEKKEGDEGETEKISNTPQSSQYTATSFTRILKADGIRINMGGMDLNKARYGGYCSPDDDGTTCQSVERIAFF